MLGTLDLKCHLRFHGQTIKQKQIYDINKIQFLFLELGHKNSLSLFFFPPYFGYYTLWGCALCLEKEDLSTSYPMGEEQ